MMHNYIKYNSLKASLLKSFKNINRLVHNNKYSTTIVKYSTNFAAAYVPKPVEKDKYSNWEHNNYFTPKSDLSKKFSLILPPPNITGTLHLGHALTIAVEDAIVRWHRMQGSSVVWVPGLDHAGIATQVVVEKKLWAEKKQTRHSLGREKFVEEVWKWKHEKQSIIENQLRQLGASLDWSRLNFTMDHNQSEVVKTAFIRLFDKGLIYRSNSLVNWSCQLQSAISDVELDQVEVNGPTKISVPGYENSIEFGVLFNFAYKVLDSDDEVIVSTTRPETILGDVAIAVHPDDERYTNLRGKCVWHPFRKEAIPILFDEFVDREFGTGAVKITPAHDRTDFEIGNKYSLPVLDVIDENGLITGNFGPCFGGIRRFDVRSIILENLDDMGLFRGAKDHTMVLPICSRSNDIVEYLLKPQWFINCQNMANSAVSLVRTGQLIIEPDIFERNWFNWLENIKDWNISRQLWWGHRIPAYECWSEDNDQHKIWIAAENESIAQQKASEQLKRKCIVIKQDEDVLDTWFSSALLPFSVFGWPNITKDLLKFYPLNMIETGHDILFFWVARMVMLGIELTDQLPFSKILLHGIVCDAEGRKMSKSLGNVVSPDDIIHGISLLDLNLQIKQNYESGILSKSELEKALEGQKKMFPNGVSACGADALRFTLCSHNIKTHFINFDISECNTNRLFCNKIWQATKYTRMANERLNIQNKCTTLKSTNPSLMDQWILSRLSNLVRTLNNSLPTADLHVCTSALKTFFYNELCDIYIECTKLSFRNIEQDKNKSRALEHYIILFQCLEVGLRCLAPFMPYLSDELYLQLSMENSSVHSTNFPATEYFDQFRNVKLENNVNIMMETVVAIRRLRSKTKNKNVFVIIETNDILYEKFKSDIEILTSFHCELTKTLDLKHKKDLIFSDTVGSNCVIHLISNISQEKLENEKAFDVIISKKELKLIKKLQKLREITTQEGYILKAPEQVKKNHTEKIERVSEELEKLRRMTKKT